MSHALNSKLCATESTNNTSKMGTTNKVSILNNRIRMSHSQFEITK